MKTNRRRVRQKRFSAFVAVALTVGIAFALLTKSRLLPYQVSRYVNGHWLSGTRYELSCRAISGNLIRDVVLRDVTLRYNGSAASFNVFRADEIALSFDMLEVLRLNLKVYDLVVKGARVQMRQGPKGELLVPALSVGGSRRTTLSPVATVDRFEIDGLQVYFGGGGRELAVHNVGLSGKLDYRNSRAKIEIDRGSAYLVDSDKRVKSFEVSVVAAGDSISVRDFALRLDESLVMANGAWIGGRLADLRLVFNPAVLGEFHELGLIPSVKGEFGGNAVVNGPLDSLSVSGSVTGSVAGIAVSGMSFEGVVTPREFSFSRARGEVFGARADGSFRYSLRDGSFGFDGSTEGLDLTHGFIPGSGLPATDLTGAASIAFEPATATYRFSAALDSARFDGYQSGRLAAAGSWTEGSGLAIDRFRAERPGYVVEGAGTIDEKGVADVIFAGRGHDLSYFWDFAGLPEITGLFDVTGRLSGRYGAMRVNVNGAVPTGGFRFAEIDSAGVQAEIRGLGSTARARVDVTGPRIRLSGRAFSNVHLLLEADSAGTVVRDFSFSAGDTFVTVDFSVAERGDSVAIGLRHASVRTRSETWEASSPATLSIHSNRVALDTLILVSPAGSVGIVAEYFPENGGVRGTTWGRNVDLSLVGRLVSAPIVLGGRADYAIRMHGRPDEPSVSARLNATAGRVDSVSFDRLSVVARYDGRGYAIDSLLYSAGESRVNAAGLWPASVSPVDLIGSGLGRDDLAGVGADFDARVKSLPLTTVFSALHVAPPFGGTFTGRLHVGGSIGSPEGNLKGSLSESPGAGLRIAPAKIEASYRDGFVRVDRLALGKDETVALEGRYPVVLDFAKGFAVRDTGHIALHAVFQHCDLERFQQFTRELTDLTGTVDGEAAVSGTPAHPVFSGSLVVSDGGFRVARTTEEYDGVSARIDFIDDTARVRSLSGRSRGRNAFEASGFVAFAGFRPRAYRVDARLRDLWVADNPEFEYLLGGELTVTSQARSDGRIVPDISGRLSATKGIIRRSIETGGGGPSPLTLPTTAPGWLCGIDVHADNNVWWRNPDMNVELGGDLVVKRDYDGLYLRGDLNILRGSYTLYNNKFRITDGSLNFSAGTGIRPEVFINAYTPHSIESGRESRIYLALSWPRDEPEPRLQLSYDQPGYYETDIWRMLGGHDIAGGLAANALEKILNEQMTGVTIQVDRKTTDRRGSSGNPEAEMMIGVGKYLWEDVYLRYRQGLAVSPDREVEVEYRISNMLLIRSEIIRHSTRRYFGSLLRNTDEYNLDVKFRFEY